MGIPVNTQFYKDHKLWGVLALDVTNNSLKPFDLSVVHDVACTTFEVLNSQNLEPKQVYSMIYLSRNAEFECCFPHIDANRSANGNLMIVFKKLKPQVQPLLPAPGYLSKYFGQTLPDNPKEAKKIIGLKCLSESLPVERVEKIQKQISKSLLATMAEIMSEKKDWKVSGIRIPTKKKIPICPRTGEKDMPMNDISNAKAGLNFLCCRE